MNSASSDSDSRATRVFTSRLSRSIFILAASWFFAGLLAAQTDPAAAPGDRQARGNRGNRGANGDAGGRGNFSPEEAQTRMMTALRDQFGVTNDDEWKVIEDRLAKVSELRRSTAGGGGFGRGGGGGFGGGGGPGGGGPGGGGGNNPNRGARGGAGNPEMDSLRSALVDKAPDAEVKSRLDRLREVRKSNEEKLVKAQEDLRAVLTIRQEAVAVMAGLLP